MSFKTILISLVKFLLLAGLYFVVFMIGSGSFRTSMNWTPSADQLPWIFAGIGLVSLVNTGVISIIILRSAWTGWRLIAATAFAWFGTMTFLSQIETTWFAPALGIPYSVPITVVLQAIPLVAVFTPAAVLVWGKGRAVPKPVVVADRLPLALAEWVWKLAIIAALYVGLYFAFGSLIAWQNPALRAMYNNGADPVVFNNLYLIPLQIVRSGLWVLFAVPVIRMTRGSLWQAALLVALLFALPMNIGHAIPNPIMPDPSVRLSHFIETATSNFIFGLAVTWLLAWRPEAQATRRIAHAH